jgi:hypothetical protein
MLSVAGLVMMLLGGAWLFAPTISSGGTSISIWQAHDICTGLLNALAPNECASATAYWGAGVGVALIGAILLLAGHLRASSGPPITASLAGSVRWGG